MIRSAIRDRSGCLTTLMLLVAFGVSFCIMLVAISIGRDPIAMEPDTVTTIEWTLGSDYLQSGQQLSLLVTAEQVVFVKRTQCFQMEGMAATLMDIVDDITLELFELVPVTLQAGVDLSGMCFEDTTISEDGRVIRLVISLPHAEIIGTRISHESVVWFFTEGLFSGTIETVLDFIYATNTYAIERAIEEAIDAGLLLEASRTARADVSRLYRNLGVVQVDVYTRTVDSFPTADSVTDSTGVNELVKEGVSA